MISIVLWGTVGTSFPSAMKFFVARPFPTLEVTCEMGNSEMDRRGEDHFAIHQMQLQCCHPIQSYLRSQRSDLYYLHDDFVR